MIRATMEEAQSRLPELIGNLLRGEVLDITVDGKSVARILKADAEGEFKPRSEDAGDGRNSWPTVRGTARDREFWMAPDFNAPMNEYGEFETDTGGDDRPE